MRNKCFLMVLLSLTILLILSSNTGALISLPGGDLPGGGLPGVTLTPPIEFNVSTENLTVINFESLTDSTVSNLTYQMEAYGVVFPSGIEVLDCEFLGRCDSARSGARVIRSGDFVDEFSRRPLTIEFSSPKKLVELYVKYDNPVGVFTVTASLNAYNEEGGTVGGDTKRFSTTGAWQRFSVGSSSSSARIMRVVLSGGPDGTPPTNFFLVDDLGFEGEVTPLVPDTSSPVVTILSPASGLEFSTSSIAIRFRASDDRLIKRVDLRVLVNGTVAFEGNDCGTTGRGGCANPLEKTISATLDRGTGNYRITITACDTSDNCGSDSISLTYTPPPPPATPIAHRVQIFQGADDRLERTGRSGTPSLISKSNLLHGSNTSVRYYLLGDGGPIIGFSESLHIVVYRADGSENTYTIPSSSVAPANLPEDPMNESLRQSLFEQMLIDSTRTLDFLIPGDWLENVEYLDLRLGGRGGLSWEQVRGFRRGEFVRISGFLEYEEGDAQDGRTLSRGFKPIRFSNVKLKKLDRDYPTVASTLTDRRGYFDFIIPRETGGRYRLELKAGNYAVKVERDYDGCNEYVWWNGNHTIEIPDAERFVDMGLLRVGIDENIDFFGLWRESDEFICGLTTNRGSIPGGSAYFNIAETIRLVREYAQDPANRDEPQGIGKVYVAYPDDGPFNYFRGAAAGTPWTNPFWDEIYLSSPFEDRDLGFLDETIVHEYTHHLTEEISQNDWALAAHRRCLETDEEMAWFEGFAEYMSHLMLNTYRNDPDFYLSQERSWFDLAETPDCPVNKNIEGGIVNVLWDLVDEPGPDFPNSITEPFDNISREDAVIFKIFDTELEVPWHDAPDICAFINGDDGWKRRFEGERRATDIDPILGEYNITC